jgi:hypothetical protein
MGCGGYYLKEILSRGSGVDLQAGERGVKVMQSARQLPGSRTFQGWSRSLP